MKWFTKDEIFTSCFHFYLNQSKKKMCSKNISPLVNDNEQGPSGGGGGSSKIYNIFVERKDNIFLSCKQIFK